MRCWYADDDFIDHLTRHLATDHHVVAPLEGNDGIVRLATADSADNLALGARALLSAKKYLMPHAQHIPLQDQEVPPDIKLALLGLPPCDLHAVTLLDKALADDPHYLQKRTGLVRIGAACSPDDSCQCLVPDDFACDLFIDGTMVWACSSTGERLAAELSPFLQECLGPTVRSRSLPVRKVLPADITEKFAELEGHSLWDTASTCLACGACSAVCPTCYCFDLFDRFETNLQPRRERHWDNCLFSEFALVAGGHDFRPGTRSRLQFRMRHKFLGFGEMSGTPSCVGCGRCERHCPVGIGPGELLDQLTAQESTP